jgi:ADP-ribose pyrophosphatase YjhB (NUDIX family)
VINGQEISVSAKAAVIRDGHILLIRYDDPMVHYNLPGGRLLNGESLREAVVRKLWLECAARATAGRLLFVYEHIPDPRRPEPVDYQKVQFTFLAHLLPGSRPSNPPDATDQSAVEWRRLDDLPDLMLLPPVTGKLFEAIGRTAPYDPLLRDEDVVVT